jgi:hypothetical protein
MEPLSLGASIVAVTQLADCVVTVCKAYIDGMKDYPKDLRVIYIEVGSLAVTFRGLQLLKEDDAQDAAIRSRLWADGAIHECKRIIEDLNTLVAFDALAWPPKAEKARKLLADLARLKSSINLAIGASLL